MTDTLTPEQARIAEIFGTLKVLEDLLVTGLITGIEDGTYNRDQIQARLDMLRQQNSHDPENAWEKHDQSGAMGTISRIGGMIGIAAIVENAVNRSAGTDTK